MKPIFCGNFEFDSRQSDLERLFRKYGKVDRVDMKSGFAFVYMEDERDAEDAIRGLDRIEFGRKGRRLKVEWTKIERGGGRGAGPGSFRKSSSDAKPTKTLFVINFDPYNTKTRDLEKHFDPFGKVLHIRIRRNFAFIQYEFQEDATKALDATNMSKMMDRVISVEYAMRDDTDRKNGRSPDRARDRSPGRKRDVRERRESPPDYGRGRRRSPSPYRRERASPDYGRRPSPNSDRGPSPGPRRERSSPYNSRRHSPRERKADYASLSPLRKRESPRDGDAESPVHERHYRSRSPLARERSRS